VFVLQHLSELLWHNELVFYYGSPRMYGLVPRIGGRQVNCLATLINRGWVAYPKGTWRRDWHRSIPQRTELGDRVLTEAMVADLPLFTKRSRPRGRPRSAQAKRSKA